MAGSAGAPWPRSADFDHKGLWVGGRSAAELADAYETPLVVVDEGHVRDRAAAYVEVFGRCLWAVKAFPAQALVRIAADEGMGLLAATWGEVDTCLRAGVPASRVVLHGNNKLDREIDAAVRAGVGLVILDGEEDALRVAGAAREAGVTQAALLRVAPGVEVSAHAYVATGAPDTKFGTPVAEGMALRALKRALDAPTLAVGGLHVHVGSQLLDPGPYLAAVDVVLDLLAEARAGLGFEAEVLDVGGGMGARYTDERPLGPGELAAAIRRGLEQGCRDRGLRVPTLIAEPGRAITVGSAVTLYRVGAIKDVPGIRTYVAVDGGMSDNLRPALYGARYTMALAGRRSAAEPVPVTVVGRHCESGDVLATDVSLPGDIVRGDLLAVASTGAYEYAMASTYNKVGRPAVVLVSEHGVREILRREDEPDLARLDRGPSGVGEAAPPGGVEVRPARARDARDAIALVSAVAAEGRSIRTERVTAPAREFRRRFRSSWTRERAEIVAVAGGRVVGHLGLTREQGPALAHVAALGMAVERGWRGRGVGSALLSEALRWAGWAGVEKVGLTVFPHNDAALALYRKFGFVEEGRLRAHTKKSTGYEDEIVMARWVTEPPPARADG